MFLFFLSFIILTITRKIAKHSITTTKSEALYDGRVNTGTQTDIQTNRQCQTDTPPNHVPFVTVPAFLFQFNQKSKRFIDLYMYWSSHSSTFSLSYVTGD